VLPKIEFIFGHGTMGDKGKLVENTFCISVKETSLAFQLQSTTARYISSNSL
jgi:hypothetical protein